MRLLRRLRAIRREALGLNRRNYDYVFRWNTRELFHLADDKVATKRALAASGIPVPRTHAVLSRPDDLVWLREAARRGAADFVLKPAHGSGGGGIVAVERHDGGRWWKSSGASLTEAELEAHAADVLAGGFARNQQRDQALVEYRVRSHPDLAALSWGGVADVRVLVFLGVPVLAMLRLPTRRSDGRANLGTGGIAAGISLDGGRTVHAIGAVSGGRHPDLGVAVAGRTVPRWDEVLETAARCHDASGLGYFGADVVVDAELGPLVLELNARPGLSIQLANRRGLRPLLEAVERRAPAARSAAERVALGREIHRAVPGAR